MRIALVCDWYSPRHGGIESHLSELGSRLVAAGHAVHVITSTPGPESTETTGVVVHRLRARRLPWADVVFLPAALDEIGSYLSRERIELVHAHVSIVAPVGIGGAAVAERQRLPAVVTFHSFVPATGILARLAGGLLGASKWRARLTAVSSRVAREVQPFAPSNPVSTLPNAIDDRFWTPGALDVRDHVVLAAATRLCRKKRPALLIEAAAQLKRVLPGIPFSLRIAGSGPQESSLRRRADREGLGEIVHFVGWQEAGELRRMFRDSDVFLSPAIRESFGLAALEARAVGLPVVAMRESGVADFIRDEESGLLASSDVEFVDALVRIVRDSALRDRIRAHNRAVPVELTWDRSLRAHETIYAAAVRGRSPARGV